GIPRPAGPVRPGGRDGDDRPALREAPLHLARPDHRAQRSPGLLPLEPGPQTAGLVGMQRVKAKLYTIWCWTGCGLSTAFWGTVSLAAGLFTRSGNLQHFCMRRWSKDNLWLSRARVEIEGLENVDPERPQLYVANHSGLHDILSLAAHLPIQFRWVAKKSLFNVPFMGWHMHRSGYIPIDRQNPRHAADGSI